jgi:aspartate aminotransferase
MFERLEMAPPDPILGLTDAFKKDPRADKINLGVGVFKDAQDRTPVLECVKKAEERLLKQESTKSYLPITGAPEYGAQVRAMVFGAGHEILASKRAASAHTPGGTGALRVAGDFIQRMLHIKTLWVSNPTWENHKGVFSAAGLEIKTYPYYDAENKCLDFDGMMKALRTVPEGDAVLFHACCHNPSGMDPDVTQWAAIAECMRERKALPVIDFAYQGFGDGLEEDAAGLRLFCTPGCELIVCSSFSKNFGLYNERCGAITLVGADAESTDKAFSQMKLCIRQNYSNPPSHGGAIITTILSDPELRALWEKELKDMRDRINGMRHLFVKTLKDKGVARDFSFITRQKGMFSFSGLTKDQVAALRDKYGIFAVASGRINVAGMTENNMDRLCTAIAEILRG